MMIKSYPILPICSMLVMGCDELGLKLPSDKEEARLASIEHKIKEGEVRLNLINRKLEEEQKKLEEARAEVEFQRCRSKSSAIRAEVERLRAECARKIATHNICLAKQSEGKAEAGIGGCLLGIAAASVSMGAAAPWALGGCTVGLAVGNAIAEACPVPNCAGSLENAERKVLLERNIDTMPRCGGWLGIKVNPVEHEISGVRIKKVTSGTYAANIGLVAGDIIT
ncbi:MAG: PDZ domain-containing protein, partial [Polyangiaceae bacterium]|nr:PDZ domain-containing protein [Polyangiaceae bacterium]